MEVIDPGHYYILDRLDENFEPKSPCYPNQELRFVKRNKPAEKYPGNLDAYPGTTIQEVCRALIDRCKYVNNQERCGETEMCITHLQRVILELETRAAKRHGRKIHHVRIDIENEPTCKLCGHIKCNETCRPKILHPCPKCGAEGIEICLGCGQPTAERDCGCPAGTKYVCSKKCGREKDESGN